MKICYLLLFFVYIGMETTTTENIISKFRNFKSYQQKRILEFCNKFLAINLIDTDSITEKEMTCTECGSSFFVKNGTYTRKTDGKQQQRRLCKKCEGTQFSDKNTPLYNLKNKDKWVDFVYIMLDEKTPISISEISERIGISERTGFRWRHKFLVSLENATPFTSDTEREIDEVYFPFCVKGTIGKEKYDEYIDPKSPNNIESELRKKEKVMEDESYQVIFLLQHNRMGDFDFTPIKIQKKGIVSKADLERVMKDVDLSGKTILTDKEPSMIAYMNTLEDVNHLTFKSKDLKEGKLENKNVHNNNINGVMSQLRNWMKFFHGVSTKYLDNYLNWFRFKNLFKQVKIEEMMECSLADNQSYPRFNPT